jgi:4-diphosphocytidyl-2C-methyl-D-erythritol kinase
VNDFEAAVFEQHPRLAEIKQRLLDAGASTALMTGSGSALFGLFDNARKLARAQRSLAGERSFEISFVTRARYQGMWRRALNEHTRGDSWPPASRY